MTRAAVLLIACAALGCAQGSAIDFAMHSAPRPVPHRDLRVGEYRILGGDLHCHVLPPDSPWHVTRDLPHTLALAKENGLDFVVLTPHVPARFFLDVDKRAWVMKTQRALRARLAELPTDDVLIVPGMEYTDGQYGHVGLGFADVTAVLDELSPEELEARPERFFERWIDRGGIATINHPLLLPLEGSPLKRLHGDLSWRDFRQDGEARIVPPEIHWLSEHSPSIETYNLSLSYLRDRYLVGDEDWTLRQSAHLLDREARRQHRRIAAVGGTDSHGSYLLPTTWVLARERSIAAIHEAVLAGRTCVRGPEACTMELRGSDGVFHPVGSAIGSSGGTIEGRAQGGPVNFFVNGTLAARADEGSVVNIPLPAGRCALVRAIVGQSWSAPIYVDCPWATSSAAPP